VGCFEGGFGYGFRRLRLRDPGCSWLAMTLNLIGICWVGTLVGVWIWWMVILARCGTVLVYFRSMLLVVIVIMGCGVNLVVHNSCSMVLANFHSLWVPKTDWVLVPCSLGVCFGLLLSGFKVWYPRDVWILVFGGSTVSVFQDNDLIVSGALLKFNLNHILDLGFFNCLFANKHAQLCKFRLWFYFLFSWVLLELD
jgi:hypothetical protein